MNLNEELLLLHLAQAIGLGLGVGVILWLLRGYAPVRRVRFSVLLCAVMGGLYLVVRGTGIPGETMAVRVIVALGLMLAANALLQLFDLILWDYLLERRRSA